jgi:hypothetical protein
MSRKTNENTRIILTKILAYNVNKISAFFVEVRIQGAVNALNLTPCSEIM